MESKAWWASKTYWMNIVAAAAVVDEARLVGVLTPETEGLILAMLNLLLRAITGSRSPGEPGGFAPQVIALNACVRYPRGGMWYAW